ncbi:hypothetical protein AB0D66_24680, partial [Streptomyces sp. NPDC048270]
MNAARSSAQSTSTNPGAPSACPAGTAGSPGLAGPEPDTAAGAGAVPAASAVPGAGASAAAAYGRAGAGPAAGADAGAAGPAGACGAAKAPYGLSSYPHPRLMPDFWEFPTVSMGLGPL